MLDRWIDGARAPRSTSSTPARSSPTTPTRTRPRSPSRCRSASRSPRVATSSWPCGTAGGSARTSSRGSRVLMWGRLPDPLGAPSAFTLTEAGTLVAALTDRLAAALADRRGRRLGCRRTDRSRCGRRSSGAGRRPRCSGSRLARIDELGARLDAALASKDRDAHHGRRSTAVDAEVTGLERDLIKETSLRTEHRAPARRAPATATRSSSRVPDAIAALADRCRSRIAGAPTLAGPVGRGARTAAALPDATASSDWAAARAVLDDYAHRLDRCRRGVRRGRGALRRAAATRATTCAACSARTATRAARSGLAEDAALDRRPTGRRTTCCGRRRATSTRRRRARRATTSDAVRVATVPAPSTRRPSRPMHERRRGRERAALRRAGVHRADRGRLLQRLRHRPGRDVRSGARRSTARLVGVDRVRGASISMKLSSTPIGSARAGLSRPTRRLVTATQPRPAPRRRHHQRPGGAGRRSAVGRARRTRRSPRRSGSARRAAQPVGRSRDGKPGRTEGFCPKCRHAVLVHAEAARRRRRRRPVRGGRVHRARRARLDLPGARPQRVRPLRRAQGPAEHRRRRRVRGRRRRAPVPRRGAAPAHPRDLQLRQLRRRRLHRHGVRRRPVAQADPQGPHARERRRVRPDPRRPGDRLHHRDPPRVLVPALAGAALLRLQARQRDPGRRHASSSSTSAACGASTTTSRRSTARSATRRRRSAEVGPSVPSDIFTIGRTLAVLAMEFRGYQSTYVAALPPVDDTPALPALRLALPRARQGDRDESRRPLPVGRRAARPAARRAARGGGRRQRRRRGGALQPRRRCSARRPAPARTSAGPTCPVLRIDRADPSATWLAGVSLADGAQRLEVLEQAPEQTVEVQLAKARAAIDAGDFPVADQVVERRPHRQPVGVAGGLALGPRGPRARPTSRPPRPRSTPCSGRCPASSRPSSRSRSPASRPAPRTSPNSSTPCARRPTPTTSRRRRSAWPAPARTGATPPAASTALDLVAPDERCLRRGSSPARRPAHRGRARPRRARAAAAASVENITIDPRDRLDHPACAILTAAIDEVVRAGDAAADDDRRRRGHDETDLRAAAERAFRDLATLTSDRGRAHPSRRRRQRGPAPDARVSVCPVLRRARSRDDRPVLRVVRRDAGRRGGPGRRGARSPSNRRSSRSCRRRRARLLRERRRDRAAVPAAARSTPTVGARCAGCARVDERDHCTEQVAPERRGASATRGWCTRGTRTRPRSRRRTTGSCSSSATA